MQIEKALEYQKFAFFRLEFHKKFPISILFSGVVWYSCVTNQTNEKKNLFVCGFFISIVKMFRKLENVWLVDGLQKTNIESILNE